MKHRTFFSKSWWRVPLLLLVCLFGGNSPTWAEVHFQSEYRQWTSHEPTKEEPYFGIDMLFYDYRGKDSFFTHDKADDLHDGPAVWVDGNYICSPDNELAWPGSSGQGNSDGAKKACQDDDWYGNTYDSEYCTIRFWNPYHENSSAPNGLIPDDNRLRIEMRVYIKNWQPGSTHTVHVKGYWRINQTSEGWEEWEWYCGAYPSLWNNASLTATMTDYNTVSLSGTLGGENYGETTMGLYTAETSVPSEYKGSGFATTRTFTAGTNTFSAITTDVTRSDYKNPMTLPVQLSIPNSIHDVSMHAYKWYGVTVPGFVYPDKNKMGLTQTNQWTRKAVVTWTPDSSNNRISAGTWTIRNKTTNTIVARDVPYRTRSQEVTLSNYGTLNTFEVYFVPTGLDGLPTDLVSAVTDSIKRSFSFTDVTATDTLSDKITLSWRHTPFGDASDRSYTLIIERSKDKTNWAELTRITVSDPTIGSGSYDDTNVENWTTYWYRLKVAALGTTFRSPEISGVLKGVTTIKSFTASRGMYSGMVKLKWEANQLGSSTTYFTISRRPLGSTHENEWAELHTTSGVGASYTFDDVTALPGNYYEYSVIPSVIIPGNNGQQTVVNGKIAKTDGFSLSAGIVSGHITYGTGTAVGDVKVILKPNDDVAGLRSVTLDGVSSGFSYNTTADEIQSLFAGDFTFQMYLNPQKSDNGTTRYLLADINQLFDIFLDVDTLDSNRWVVGTWINKKYRGAPGLYIYPNEWVHLSCVHNHDTQTTTIYLIKDGVITSANTATNQPLVWTGSALKSKNMSVGNYYQLTSAFGFRGSLDEFRFFTKALSEEEILRNYNHTLVGNESNLAIYYPFDEGLENQTIAYDFSKTGGVPNGRHAKANVAVTSTPKTPSPDQLSLMAYTDSVGNYTVSGVPFSGDGVNYIITPTLGIHEFSPAYKTAYVSSNSLVHSGVDFDDVSSFPVSGHVYYEGTDYPVKGVTFTVDGNTCSRDGEIIETDDQGKFTISVPIGDHFIQAKLTGHDFKNNGRYPADPNNVGIRRTFDRAIPDLEFNDVTLVNFTGRVVGGDIEGSKPVGFGLSDNNIGKARLVLSPANTNSYRLNVIDDPETVTIVDYIPNPKTLSAPSSTSSIGSRSWRGALSQCGKIFIETDSLTGEFSAMVPPLSYILDSVYVVNSNMNLLENRKTLDMTQPVVIYKDSIENAEGGYAYYAYNTKLLHTYHSDPVFNVTQFGREDGSFGINTYTIKDGENDLVIDDIISKNENNSVVYTYGHPIFKEMDTYTYMIEGYEEYINADDPTNQSRVPMADVVVTIENGLSTDQAVYGENNLEGAEPGSVSDLQSNQLQLDSLGQATYKWKAGLPNITPPYSRSLELYYTIGSRTIPWSGNAIGGIILGSLPTGNNFVTAGPDQLDMILRDPPGSKSKAEWSTGTAVTKTTSNGGTWSSENTVKSTSHLGAEVKVASGAIALYKIEEVKTKWDLDVGVKASTQGENANTWSREVTATKTIATSDAMEYVGAQGDVFVGSSTNIVYGMARDVDFYPNRGAAEGEPKAVLQLNDIITTGLDFKTEFAYTQNYIENVLIPNFEKMRNSKLQTVSQIGSSNPGSYPIYQTLLDENDERYGSSNHDKDVWGNEAEDAPKPSGPSYTMIRPDGADAGENFQDSVEWCNTQIRAWQSYLAFNEMEKVDAYKNRTSDTKNYSFDSGTSITNSVEKKEAHGHTLDFTVSAVAILGTTFGVGYNGTGVTWELETETGGGYHYQTEENEEATESFNYTLAEEGDDDALTVDVYEEGAFGPIFRTRAGQTSAPYEGEVVTKYYMPGTVIMEATMQIEVPDIDAKPKRVEDVPTGGVANFTLELTNKSEIDEDVYYRLLVDDESNPNGAILMIDGKVVTDSRIIKIPAGQTIYKSLQLKQSNLSILNYDNIALVLASQSQYDPTSTWDVIADTTYITAHFVPSSSPVELALSTTTMNTETYTDLDLTLSGFDRNYRGLKAFRLQYKKKGSANWTDFHEYVVSGSNLSSTQELLPENGATIKYTFNMGGLPDGDYLFRVASVAEYDPNNEIYRYSDEIALVKDMQIPRPLGIPEPSDGVLDIGDELSVTFNETILKGELTDARNFLVTGVLNGAEVAHETALSLQGTDAAAATEANINLANKNFSIDAWVRISGAGTLLSHGQGTNKLNIGTDADGKLVVNMAGNTYTSSNSVPTNKWSFLTLNYQITNNGSNLNASVAYDAVIDTLFDSRPVVSYVGNGPLSVGCGSVSAIHELLLWDEAHDIATALMNRSKTKNPSTRHLIGYWKMDEGEGTTIRDYARNRHMTMADETWYLNNVNKALDLNGSNYLSIITQNLPNNNMYNDYALEFWMRGDQQTGEAQLLQMGEISLWVNVNGVLQLTSNGATSQVGSQSLTDNVWHHVALNVLRLGSAAVYVDGKRQLMTAANNVGNIVGDELVLGAANDGNTYSRFFNGQVDEVRVWNATLNANQILANHKVRLTGTEPGLSIYYPFEKTGLDEYNQLETFGVCENATSVDAAPRDVLNSFTDNAPALHTRPTETNVPFNFTASDNKIVIELDEDENVSYEGCTLHFTVRDVSDENGNRSVPAVWSAFINRNELVWQEDVVSVEQEVTDESSFTATIVNKGGKQQSWVLSGMPSWLTASADYGTANPRSETTVTFSVSPATPIGKYEETVYLEGSNGITAPLTVNVKVTGPVPNWAVNPSDFEKSMNVIGRVEIEGLPMEDEDDIVAAFIGEECRGVAHPVYKERYDGSYITMDIYGNDEVNQEVTFRAYDASTGALYPVVTPDRDIKFTPLALIGKYDAPVVFTVADLIEQQTELKAGWNWLSLYVTPEDMTVPAVFEKIADDVMNVKSQNDGYLTYENNTWGGNLTGSLDNTQMYAVQLKSDRTLRVVGRRIKPDSTLVTVEEGWNWIGYYGRNVASVGDALTGLQPENGDILKGQRGVSYFDIYEWAGSLVMMEPGIGYMLMSNTSYSRQFSYPSSTVTTPYGLRRRARSNGGDAAENSSAFTPVNFRMYANNAIMAVQLTDGGRILSDTELGVFADDECRAAVRTNEDGIAYLTIPGDDVTLLTFKIVLGEEIIDAPQSVEYEVDGVYGSPQNPLVIDLNGATGIWTMAGDQNAPVYDLQGRMVRNGESSYRKLPKGVYIMNGQKKTVK